MGRSLILIARYAKLILALSLLMPLAASAKDPQAIVKTTLGSFTIQLFFHDAPKNVQNFMELAAGEKEFTDAKTGRRVHRPFYNGLIFHKVVPDFVIQGGCPFGNGKGGPGYTLPDEISTAHRHDRAGIVSMANIGKDTNGSQFFITLASRPELDDKYTIIGEVIKGMDVVEKIGRAPTGPTSRPAKRIYIESIEIKAVDKPETKDK
jgi:peptidyl-prolyl cis-trans isomerase A (cyclophilin A)